MTDSECAAITHRPNTSISFRKDSSLPRRLLLSIHFTATYFPLSTFSSARTTSEKAPLKQKLQII